MDVMSPSTAVQMFAISAPLGMLLDNYHGLFGVLRYTTDLSIQLAVPGASGPFLRTAFWVPPLFGAAGVVMSAIILYLDKHLQTPECAANPSWSRTWLSVSFFSFQYYLSGLFDSIVGSDPGSIPSLHAGLATMALVGWQLFDGSIAGLWLALATAVAGPAAELFLVNVPGLYSYTHGDLYGICSWIPWVYFLGAPAVGNLARRVQRDGSVAVGLGLGLGLEVETDRD